MLLEKYKPEILGEFLGNREQISAIKAWLRNWKKGSALMLAGQSGCGKSLAVELIAKESGYELLKSHADEKRSHNEFEGVIKSSQQRSLIHKNKIILVDDMEAMESSKGIIELIKSSEHPVILIAADPYERSLAAIRKQCRIIRFSKIRHETIAAFLKGICEKEGMNYSECAIGQLARTCNGDLRAALIDLDSGYSYRESEESVFNTLRIIFKASGMESVQTAINNSDKPVDELLLWIEENIAEEYRDAEDIAKAFDCLSKADITSARIIRRQSWTLQKYLNTAIHGVAMSKKNANRNFVNYMPPKLFARNNDLSGAAKELHCSKKKAAEYKHLAELLSRNQDM